MIYGFLFGKNPELSLAELSHYLKNREIRFEIIKTSQNFSIIDTDINPLILSKDLGGTIKIGEYYEYEKLIEEIASKQKPKFGLSVYPKNKKVYDEIKNKITEKLKQERIKYVFISSKFYGSTELKHFEVLKKILKKDGIEIMVFWDERKYFFKTLAVHDPSEFKIRDVKKPVQRTIYSIPPRLAKILINLCSKPGDRLLDPFCGMGTIMQEAMLMNIFPIGMDKNPKCIKGTETNLKWIKQIFNVEQDFKIVEGDATRLSHYFEENTIDCIATEPYLGPPLKSKPNKEKAERIINSLKHLYLDFLIETSKVLKPKGKISLVFPNFITIDGKEVRMDVEEIASSASLKVLELINGKKSIIDADERQMTRREIVLMQK
jgi:tRNA G10  N-methylase Trm11